MIFRGLSLPEVPYDYRLVDTARYVLRVRAASDAAANAVVHVEVGHVWFDRDAPHQSVAMQAMVDALNAAAATS